MDDASSVYSQIEHATREEITAHGGSVSQHHGVGKVRPAF
jgi:alkyldihydroxyacetonephosphate synthase